MDLCNAFKKESLIVWSKLKAAKSINYQLGEETLTDMLILRLGLQNFNDFNINAYTKSEEGKNGADWEMWLHDLNGKWLGFRVQAKVLNLEKNEYKQLHYKRQTAKLIIKARKETPKRIPLYLLYTMWDQKFDTSQTVLKDKEWLYGCSIIDAYKVFKKYKKTRKLSQLLDDMYPWHFLVCHGSETSQSIVQNAFKFWSETIVKSLDSNDTPQEHNFIINGDGRPKYLKLLQDGQQLDSIDVDLSKVVIVSQTENDRKLNRIPSF